MPWFVEEKTTMGRWAPKVYRVNLPTEKGNHNPKKFRNAPVEISDEMARWPLGKLQALFRTDDDDCAADQAESVNKFVENFMRRATDDQLKAAKKALESYDGG